MGDPSLIKNLNNSWMLKDQVSIENMIIAIKSQKWSLCIDPQQQANKWIKAMEKDNLLSLNQNSSHLMKQLGNAVRNGKSCLLENVSEVIDQQFDPLLFKNKFKDAGGHQQIRFQNTNIDYDDNFKLIMTTKISNPHYSPEVFGKLSVINFSLTLESLEQNLLQQIILQERPEILEQKYQIEELTNISQKQLKNTEQIIQGILAQSQGNLLKEDNLLNFLKTINSFGKNIIEQKKQLLVIEQELNSLRKFYKPVASRASILCFAISDLAKIDNMYQFSMEQITKLIFKAINNCLKNSSDAQVRDQVLIDTITKTLYSKISTGLFDAHKILYSFLIATNINRKSQKIKESLWNVFLRGSGIKTVPQKSQIIKNPDSQLISQIGWDLLSYLNNNEIESFDGLCDSINNNKEEWKQWCTHQEPHTVDPPQQFAQKLGNFEKLILIKAFRPEKLPSAIKNYVKKELSEFYIENPPIAIQDVFRDIDSMTPLIFVLGTGEDPTENLIKFAKEKNLLEKLKYISLGQGQGEKAEELIKHAMQHGGWVLLKDCHHAPSWMSHLERIFTSIQEEQGKVHQDFRLFLTSKPHLNFPALILQNGVKLAIESPKGLKAILKRSFDEISDGYLIDCKKPEVFNKLLFNLCFFHAVVHERRRFESQGMNIRFELIKSDLTHSQIMLKQLLNDHEDIPWKTLQFQLGQINYAGRMRDNVDRKSVESLFNNYINPNSLQENYKFSPSGIYYVPPSVSLDSYKTYIDQLPLIDHPEILGLHENASIYNQKQQSDFILETILSIEPIGKDKKSQDQIILEKIEYLQKQLPLNLDKHKGQEDLFKPDSQGLIQSLNAFLLQEIERFNNLLNTIRTNLNRLKMGIKGEVIMTHELNQIYISMLNDKVPNWPRFTSYPYTKSLISWIKDLIKRVEFMNDWLTNGVPNSFWFPGFIYPQGFLAACLQMHSRKHKMTIDSLTISYIVKQETDPSLIKEAPQDGVFIHGLSLDGCRWDQQNQVIEEQIPGETYPKMPLIWLLPKQDFKSDPEKYACPIYKLSRNWGSPLLPSQTFIAFAELPTKEKPNRWNIRSAALICDQNY